MSTRHCWTSQQCHQPRTGGLLDWLPGRTARQRVLLFFGQNESYDGLEGLTQFEQRLSNYLTLIKARHSGAKLTLVSPIAIEDLGNASLPDASVVVKLMCFAGLSA